MSNASKWIDVPSLNALSREQREVYSYSLDSNLIINGAAGSGKTILALMRAMQLVKKNKKVLFITYTKILHQFTLIAAQGHGLEVGRDIDIEYTSEMAKKVFGRHMASLENISDSMVERLVNKMGGYDAVIIDEGQDFSISVFQRIFKRLGDVHTVCCDDKQSLYETDFTREMVQRVYEPIKDKNLDFTYRNPKKIAQTSMGFFMKKFESMAPVDEDITLKVYNEYNGAATMIHSINEIQTIVKLIKNRAENTVGILLPNNQAVKMITDSLSVGGIGTVEYKYYINGGGGNTCNFSTLNPKIMTYHSAKGIQFDSVIIPLLSNNYETDLWFSNTPEEARAFYVAMTRAKKNLYFIHPEDPLCPYTDFIPKQFIKTKQVGENRARTIDDIFDFGDD
tara:strand:- start:3328 stop:4512 length:1185 start_codon:yes stop_codon:yes gene_type:complete